MVLKEDVDSKLKKIIPDFENRIENIPLEDIEFNSYNPRKNFGQEEEDDLIQSINSRGILVPIIVFQTTKAGNKKYQSVPYFGQLEYLKPPKNDAFRG